MRRPKHLGVKKSLEKIPTPEKKNKQAIKEQEKKKKTTIPFLGNRPLGKKPASGNLGKFSLNVKESSPTKNASMRWKVGDSWPEISSQNN